MTTAGREQDERGSRPRSVLGLACLGLLAVLAFAGLFALGLWQVHRLAWKEDLIARVDARVHAAPVAAPPPSAWAAVTPQADEYRRVAVTGTLDNARETLVQAVTVIGPGYWVLTPMRTTDGWTVLVNRGFVPLDRRDAATRAAGQTDAVVTIVGLLRISEPDGGFLRGNDPAADHWFSRDVAAIVTKRGLADAAPFFIDADATPNPGGLPVGGLSVIAFPNNHLVYALTWFALAAMVAAAIAWLVRAEWRARHVPTSRGNPRDALLRPSP